MSYEGTAGQPIPHRYCSNCGLVVLEVDTLPAPYVPHELHGTCPRCGHYQLEKPT